MKIVHITVLVIQLDTSIWLVINCHKNGENWNNYVSNHIRFVGFFLCRLEKNIEKNLQAPAEQIYFI